MSVSLVVTNADGRVVGSVPVATLIAFHQVWLVGCKELKLSTIPKLEDYIEREDIPSLLVELGLLRDWFRETQEEHVSKDLFERVDRLVILLRTVQSDPSLQMY